MRCSVYLSGFYEFYIKKPFAFNFDVGHSYWEQNEVL